MMIAKGKNSMGENLLILGISKENVERLLKGNPISVNQRAHGQACPLGWEIQIHYGTIEQEILLKLKAEGVDFSEAREGKIDPRLFS